ncbi:MAG: glycosyltransferase [Oscillospiraceae bacterium]|jgi:glycosyltransferase involved in cell wall biosynthesis|nr:glycosyltransferase [Oscillospiraceae bacterium]
MLVQIFLSTYNGEKYLREQLDSFVKQTIFGDVGVLIRDDGSKDGTVAILREYEEKYGFEVIAGENLGAIKSYFALFDKRDKEAKYFAFSDQDDCWLPDKLEQAASALEEYADVPAALGACSAITDENLNKIGMFEPVTKGIGFYNAVLQNIIPGHSQVVNVKLMDILAESFSPDIAFLDWWVYLIASAVGKVVYKSEPNVLHRQHGDNQWGYKPKKFQRLVGRVRKFLKMNINSTTKQLAAFEQLNLKLPNDYKAEMQRFLLSQKTFFKRLKYALTSKCFRQSGLETLAFRFFYAVGKYRA